MKGICRKLFLSGLMLISFLLSCVGTVLAAGTGNGENGSESTVIAELLEAYFSYREQQVTKEASEELPVIVSDSVREDLSLRAYGLQKMEKRIMATFTEAQTTCTVSKQEIQEDQVVVYCEEFTFITYVNTSGQAQDQMGFGASHVITFVPLQDTYQILSDSCDERLTIGYCSEDLTNTPGESVFNYDLRQEFRAYTRIQETLDAYFTWQSEALIGTKDVSGLTCVSGTVRNDIQSWLQSLRAGEERIGAAFLKAVPTCTIHSLQMHEGRYIVFCDVMYLVDYQHSGSSVTEQLGFGNYHTIILQLTEDSYVIEKDSFDDRNGFGACSSDFLAGYAGNVLLQYEMGRILPEHSLLLEDYFQSCDDGREESMEEIEASLNIEILGSSSAYAIERSLVKDNAIMLQCKVWSMIRFRNIDTFQEDYLNQTATHILTICPGEEQSEIISDQLIRREYLGAYEEQLKAFCVNEPGGIEAMLRESEEVYPETAPQEDMEQEQSAQTCIFIGDSRFHYMVQVVGMKAQHQGITLGGATYSWFETEALPQLYAALRKNPDAAVIINMGLNDCALKTQFGPDHTESYLQRYREIKALYPEAKLCFASVGPVNGAYGDVISPERLNPVVKSFNNVLAAQGKDILYIPLGEYLEQEGFQTVDGIHYDYETSMRIYDYCCQFLENQ